MVDKDYVFFGACQLPIVAIFLYLHSHNVKNI